MIKAVALVALFVATSLAFRAPLHLAPVGKAVKDSYIIVLNQNVSVEARQLHINKYSASQNFAVDDVWDSINGYHATISEPDVLRVLLADENVQFVEEDQVMSISYQQDKAAEPLDTVSTQSGLAAGLWGLTRIWQRTRASTTTYQYWTSAGTGVDCYILDTGVRSTHVDFGGRNATGAAFVNDNAPYQGTEDGNGHGTHVASTVAGTTYGVAKKCTIIAVKVLSASGSGTTQGVISGVEWTGNNKATRRNNRPSTANMSLGGGASAALDNAVTAAIGKGVTFVVAAGNDNANACNYSPARTPNAITVGSTMNTEARSSFSNFGTCVDVFAPGSSILGAWYTSNTATNTISGTSMASPHVCGATALFMGNVAADRTPAQVKTEINNRATSNAVTNPGTGSPNRLLFTAGGFP